jgi:HEAT repeat protein
MSLTTDWNALESQMRENDQKEKQALWRTLEQDREIPDPAALKHLSGLLGGEITRFREAWSALDVDVRQALVRTLQHMAEADFAMDFSAIFRIAMQDEDAEVRAVAVEGLYEVEDVRLVPVLVDMARRDPSPAVRVAAIQTLSQFVLLGELQKIRPAPFQTAVQALKEAHADRQEDVEVRRRAMEALAYTGSYDVPEIIAMAYKEGGERMRISAVFAMGRSADKIWGDIVRHELHNPEPEMRFEATRAVGELQLREAVKEIAELVEDVDAEIRAMALWSLGQIGGNLARRTLQRYVDSDNEALRDAAREALQELEFFHGDLSTFFGPPADFDGESDTAWHIPGMLNVNEDDADLPGDDGDRDRESDDDDEALDDDVLEGWS